MNTKPYTFLALDKRPVKYIEPPTWDSIKDQRSFKYAALDFVMRNSTEPIRAILKQMPIEGNHRYVVVDVKLHDIIEGQFPCLPGWHMDCTLNPWHDTKPDVHHIYVVGAGCRTRFLAEDFTMEFPTVIPAQVKTLMNSVEHKSWKAEEAHVYRYDRFGLHAPSVAESTGKRMLIRVTETDLIRPNRRYFSKFTTGRYKGTSRSRR
jgi:hypothetical protein